MIKSQNVVGPAIRRIRYQKGWTQEVLAAKLTTLTGWDISRGTLSKIEAGLRCVTDEEIMCFAKALAVKIDDLFPKRTRNGQ